MAYRKTQADLDKIARRQYFDGTNIMAGSLAPHSRSTGAGAQSRILYRKSQSMRGAEESLIALIRRHSQEVHSLIASVQSLPPNARVLEIGSGAHGLIFFFPTQAGIGVDPVAVEYATMLPRLQRGAQICAAFGEQLPFLADSFDVVLCDNVIDHAERPEEIVHKFARVLKPRGLLYFSVNVHHPIYDVVSMRHGAWTAAGARFEIQPFAFHTVHLTLRQARKMVRVLPVRIHIERDGIGKMKIRSADHTAQAARRSAEASFFQERATVRQFSFGLEDAPRASDAVRST